MVSAAAVFTAVIDLSVTIIVGNKLVSATMLNVLATVDFVANQQLTFNKVDRVEFNFVASVCGTIYLPGTFAIQARSVPPSALRGHGYKLLKRHCHHN